MMKKYDKKDNLFKECSNKLKEYVSAVLLEKDQVVIGLPGGRSILPVLNHFKTEDLPWEKIHVFMVDERLVPIESKDSNFKLINKGLKVVLPKENFHPFIIQQDAIDLGMNSYKDEIKKFGSKFDIVLVSSGEDGHIAALYPNHSSIKDESDFLIVMNNSPKPPAERITFSKNFIQNSTFGILLFVGDVKKYAYNDFKSDEVDFQSCPAKLVQNISNHSVFAYDV